MKKLKYLMTIALLLMAGVLIYSYVISKDKKVPNTEGETTVSQVSKALEKNVESNYPKTPREVVLYFTDIQKCYYNEEYSDDELVKLAYQAQKLFDEELVMENDFDEYYENLKLEIDEYKSEQKIIAKVIADRASDVIYSEIDGINYAQLNCIYYIKRDGKTNKVVEQYALRCDNNGKWKILGWDYYQPSEYEQQ